MLWTTAIRHDGSDCIEDEDSSLGYGTVELGKCLLKDSYTLHILCIYTD